MRCAWMPQTPTEWLADHIWRYYPLPTYGARAEQRRYRVRAPRVKAPAPIDPRQTALAFEAAHG